MISKIGFVRCICTVVLALAMAAGLSGQAHASNYKVLYDFCARSGCIDGSDPQAGLALDSNENLYGTTYLGGTIGNGTAFELAYDPAKKKWKHVVLHNFCLRVKDNTCVDGEQPLGKLIIDVNGNLYGTNYHGGSSITGGGGTRDAEFADQPLSSAFSAPPREILVGRASPATTVMNERS